MDTSTRKIIQIQLIDEPNESSETLICLCDDGSVWSLRDYNWYCYKNVPQHNVDDNGISYEPK